MTNDDVYNAASRGNKNKMMMAMFTLVAFSVLFSPAAIESKEHEVSSAATLLANDTSGKDDWTENETILCAIISIGGLIMFGIFYFGIVRER